MRRLKQTPAIILTLVILILICFQSMVISGSLKQTIPAFPGAEGAGAMAIGGRGGEVIFVTNLNDDGPGSLRAACEINGPRTILFRTSGNIELKSPLEITEPFVTIAGQSAPGDGVCLKNYGCMIRDTHDVVVQYIRFRPGDVSGSEEDALSIFQAQNVIIDHCSAGWSVDETLSVTGGGTDNITVQWCFITESLNNSVHHKGKHGYGSLLRVDGNISFHHNLYACHDSRNPRPGTYGDENRGGFLDFRNNVIYNWGSRPGYSAGDKTSINYIGNYLKPGPSTREDRKEYAFYIGSSTTTMFVENNYMQNFPDKGSWEMIHIREGLTEKDVRIPVPMISAPVQTENPQTAFQKVIENAGAVLPVRDKTDQRVVEDVKNGTGKIIDSQKQVGGWPALSSSKPPQDSDMDGMPDAWEKQYGLNPEKSNSKLDRDRDGFTNIEEFLNQTDPSSK